MKTNVTTFHILYVLFLVVCFSFIFSSGYAQELYEERQYEPIVLCGFTLSKFYDVPIDEIYMYAYRDSSWSLIPFQIDEKTYGPDSMNTRIKRWWYFIPEWWANVDSIGINSHDGLLTGHDELVFMIADLGDKASASDWIDNDESKNYQRLEIEVTDPFNENRKAYGYLYRSSSIGEDIPRPYDFRINLADHIVENNRYSIRISQQTGLIEDVVIKPPYGSGVDIFDTQKIRFAGILNFGQFTIPIGKGGNPAANERDNLYVYQHTIHYTTNPVVRVVREVKQSMRFGNYPLDQLSFYVVTKFYPCNGTLEGGADLDPNKLKDLFGTEEDIIIQLDLLRESWDFNAATSGMKFYNRYNNGVSIDGVLDEVVKTIDVPIKEWFLTTGNQGTMFTQIEFQDTSWMGIELYFYDSQQGGQGDGMYVPGIDTGDSLSFGDQGILFTNLTQDSVNLKLGFNAYFADTSKIISFHDVLQDSALLKLMKYTKEEYSKIGSKAEIVNRAFRNNPDYNTINIENDLARIDIPTAVIQGDQDYVVGLGHADLIYNALTNLSPENKELHILPNTGHCPAIENPKTLSEILIHFFKKHN